MMAVMEVLLAIVLSATIEIPAGDDLAAALARARPGDVLRLGPGEHRGALGRLSGVEVEGTGAGVTVVLAPEGEDALVATGEVGLRALSLHAGAERCALKVLGGAVRLEGVVLAGGACGAFVDGGRIEGRDVHLFGGYGLLLREGDVSLDAGTARGAAAGVGVVGGALALRRFAVSGPSREAGISVAGGSASLEAVVIRDPGPSGISLAAGASLSAVAVTVAGVSEASGFPGACVQAIRGDLAVEGATLVRCAGVAVEASGGALALRGVDAVGGQAGCLAFVNGADASLSGNLCVGRGPGLVLASGSRARAEMNRWWTDPVFWVECGSGARVRLGRGETAREPCAGDPPGTD
jgi:hypothetical protein